MTELTLLFLGRVRSRSISLKPILEDVGGLLGEIASSFPIESILVKANVLLEPNITIRLLISWPWV